MAPVAAPCGSSTEPPDVMGRGVLITLTGAARSQATCILVPEIKKSRDGWKTERKITTGTFLYLSTRECVNTDIENHSGSAIPACRERVQEHTLTGLSSRAGTRPSSFWGHTLAQPNTAVPAAFACAEQLPTPEPEGP